MPRFWNWCRHPSLVTTVNTKQTKNWILWWILTYQVPFSNRLLSKSSRLSMIRNGVWALSNLCRGKNPPPNFSKVKFNICFCATLINLDVDAIVYIGFTMSSRPRSFTVSRGSGCFSWCMLGSFLLIWWTKWQDSSRHWRWCLSAPSWTAHVELTSLFVKRQR